MPIYDYECRNCGQRVEVLHGVNELGPAACARCGGAMRKVLATPAIVFKGSGWAKKDRATKPAGRGEEMPAKADETPTKADETPAKGGGSDSAPSTRAGETAAPAATPPKRTVGRGGKSAGRTGSTGSRPPD